MQDFSVMSDVTTQYAMIFYKVRQMQARKHANHSPKDSGNGAKV